MEVIKCLNVIASAKYADMVNKYGSDIGGGFEVQMLKGSAFEESFEECDSGSIIVDFDFMDDEVSKELRDAFYEEIFEVFDSVCGVLESMDYKIVGDHDGSGGGLIYGCSVYGK